MSIYIFPTGGDAWMALTLAPEDEYLPEQVILPAFLQAQAQSQSFPYIENPAAFSDFGWIAAVAAIVGAVLSYLSSRSSTVEGNMGFYQMQQYVVHGLTTKGQFLFCSDDCGKSWRITMDGAGNISIAERTYAPVGSKPNEPGSNIRFDCAELPKDLITLIKCPATLAKNAGQGAPGKDPTVGIPTWVYYVLGGGLGLVLLSSIGSRSAEPASVSTGVHKK